MSQLEAENARLKLTVQETREALDQSKTVEVRTPYHLANRERPQVLAANVDVKCELFFAGSVGIWIPTFPKQDM